MDLEMTETARKHTGILLVGAIQADAQRHREDASAL